MGNILKFTTALAVLLSVAINAAAKDEDLTLMTFNVGGKAVDGGGEHSWEARKKACMKALKKYNPDVIFLQDAFSYHKALAMKEVPKHTLVDRGSKPGTLDQELQNNENPILFRADRFELLNYGSFWLNEGQSADTPGWDASKPRNVTWVKLRYKKSGVIFFCFNTKFDEEGENAGKRSAELMADKVKEIAGDDAVIFVGGDFGMSASDRALSPLVSYVKDANFALKKPDTRASFNGYGKPGASPLWPDHILSRNARPESYEVVDSKKFGVKYISDHYPVFSSFAIRIPKGK